MAVHGELCIPVTHCHNNDPSRIILRNAQKTLHLTWTTLEMRHNVNLTERNDISYFCFHDVNESFVFWSSATSEAMIVMTLPGLSVAIVG